MRAMAELLLMGVCIILHLFICACVLCEASSLFFLYFRMANLPSGLIQLVSKLINCCR